MNDTIEKQCPGCGQRLRFPANVGGMVMVCPSCGRRFHSDFRLAAGGGRRSLWRRILSAPAGALKRLLPRSR